MRSPRQAFIGLIVLALGTLPAFAAAPVAGDFLLNDFRFHTGETLPALNQHYTALGDPKNPAVLVLHGTNGTGAGMLNAAFGGALFGHGQPLDASRYFIILPDAIGTGQSSKPSGGLRMKFPRYTYDDIVAAQYRLLTEHLHLRHLRLVIGNSMGGMVAWQWATAYPGFMDAVTPLASQPAAMSGRNWVMRRLLIETIKADPAFAGGNYTSQPLALKYAQAFFGAGTSGGTLGWQARAGTHAGAEKAVDVMLARPSDADANDVIYQFDAARDYDPAPRLSRITAWVLAINSADDERNPPETGTTARGVAALAHGKLLVIPASAETRGHGTTGQAALWRDDLARWLATVPRL